MPARARLETWPLRESFGIARGVSTVAHALHVTIERDGALGQGEAEAAEYSAAEAAQTLAQAERFLALHGDHCTRESLQELLPAGRLRNAVDCALWDLEAKLSGVRAWERAGIAPGPVHTLYTIALAEPRVMAERARAHAEWPWLKVKLGGANDEDCLAAVREAAPRARLLVDANGGWTRMQFEHHAPLLAAAGVEVLEQPLAPGSDAALEHIDSPLALCADESCRDRASLATLPTAYRYINIKLDKTGGLSEALALAGAARARGLGVMVGCNLGTSLATAPAMLIARLADIVDLDSPLLLAADREHALVYEQNLVRWPQPSLWG